MNIGLIDTRAISISLFYQSNLLEKQTWVPWRFKLSQTKHIVPGNICPSILLLWYHTVCHLVLFKTNKNIDILCCFSYQTSPHFGFRCPIWQWKSGQAKRVTLLVYQMGISQKGLHKAESFTFVGKVSLLWHLLTLCLISLLRIWVLKMFWLCYMRKTFLKTLALGLASRRVLDLKAQKMIFHPHSNSKQYKQCCG